MKIIVNYTDNRWKKYNIDFCEIANLMKNKNCKDSEVSVVLTNDKDIKKLNKKYRGINKTTNVLSFESGDDILLGDIYISFDTVMKEVYKDKNEFVNHAVHMVVHGILHLQGYDHIEDCEAEKMENKEVEILEKLNISNPYINDKTLCDKLKLNGNSLPKIMVFFIIGLLTSLGFAPFNLWFLTLLGFGAVYYCFFFGSRKPLTLFSAFLNILPFCSGYALGMFWWVINSIYVVPELTQQFQIWTVPALLGIALFGGVIFSIPFLAIRCTSIKPAYRPVLIAAAGAILLWLREWLLTGFPWNPIANISLPFPIISNSMSLFGAIGLSFVIIGLIASTVEFIKNRKSGLTSFIIFISLLIMSMFFGHQNIKKSEIKNENNSPIIRIVQPAKSAVQKASHSMQEAMQNANKNISDLTALAKTDGNYDLVVFPETSYPYLIYDKSDLNFVKEIGKPTIIGGLSYENKNLYNSLIIANNNGEIKKIYSKSHLVPFGEYRPFGDLIPTPGQLTPGSGPEVLSVDINGNNFTFVPAVCYEIVFSDSLVPKNGKPHAVINITNDTWFGKTPGSYQHLDMVRRYAIESGLPIIRANYSGISAFVLPDGTVKSELGIGKTGILDATVSGDHMTMYRKIGRDNWMIIILMFSIISVISISVFQKKD